MSHKKGQALLLYNYKSIPYKKFIICSFIILEMEAKNSFIFISFVNFTFYMCAAFFCDLISSISTALA